MSVPWLIIQMKQQFKQILLYRKLLKKKQQQQLTDGEFVKDVYWRQLKVSAPENSNLLKLSVSRHTQLADHV